MSDLTPKQEKFVELFTGGMDAKNAYIAAGYSPRGAEGAASKMQRVAKVRAAIEAARAELREKSRMKKEDALDWLIDVLRTPVGEVDENHVLAQEVVTDELGDTIVRRRVKMVGKMEAMEKLAKMLSWYEPEKHSVEVEVVIGGNADG